MRYAMVMTCLQVFESARADHARHQFSELIFSLFFFFVLAVLVIIYDAAY